MKKKIIPVLVAFVLILVVLIAMIVPELKKKYSYSKERMPLADYFKCSGNEALIMLQDAFIDDCALIVDGAVYFEMKTVASYMEDRFYYNDMEKVIKYTLPDKVETVKFDEPSVITGTVPASGTVTGTEALAHPAVLEDEGTIYFWADYVQRYCNMSYTLYGEPDSYRIQVFVREDAPDVATISKKTAVRKLGGIKSPILTDVQKDETVVVLNRMDNWSEIKTEDCVTGYIETKYLKDERTEERNRLTAYVDPVYPRFQKDGKIVMGWHQIMTKDANGTFAEMTAKAAPLNVICPTWFRIKGGGDNIELVNIAGKDYVDRAHGKGYDVWVLAEDIEYENDLYATLSSTFARERLEALLVNAALEAGADGINIDFEFVSKDCGPHFAQFLRELSILTHANGLVLSVDNYAPQGGRTQYYLKEQGIVVDYVILMGYDEHWKNCPEAGSVASIGYVERGIKDMINMGVPADKIINGVPFYTRVWTTKGADVSSTDVGMQASQDWIKRVGIKTEWDEATCQNYGEKIMDGILYQIWLEDAESLKVKLNVMNALGISGVSVWKLGFETPDVWDVIAAYANS